MPVHHVYSEFVLLYTVTVSQAVGDINVSQQAVN